MSGRLENLVWTVSENYETKINLTIFKNEISENYKAAILGICYKYYDMPYVEKFLKAHYKLSANYKDMLTIAELSMENSLIDQLIKNRPGVSDFKCEFENKLFYKYSNSAAHNLGEELEIAYYQVKNKIIPKINNTVKLLLDDILNFKSKDTLELLLFLQSIFSKYFHIYKNLPSTEKVENIIKEVKKKKEMQENGSAHLVVNYLDIAELEKYTIESAEFTSAKYENTKLTIEKNRSLKTTDKNLTASVEKHYGISYMKQSEVEKLEEKICTGVHEKVNLHFTKGEFKNPLSYNEQKAKEIYNENLNLFKEDELNYKRGIKNLSEIIKNSLLKNTEEYEIPSISGNLVAGSVWKSKHTNNSKIFKRNFTDYHGDISVDILLDASASQEERQSEIAIEAYIITEALTELNIKTRVFSFNNYFNYLVIRKFRDYNDSKLKNKEIFKYRASGSNRDGLAIKLLTDLIEKNSQDRKILIILSDGKPNDETNLGLVGIRDFGIKDYVDELALRDTYNNVLITKLKGIDVLGVFTGLEEDLETEKKIYGNDFAYITELKRFHQIVGIFLKSIADKLY
ncbi:vWA domain-containing protein [Peptoniphilus mikwangii]|uniref:hypothetical protein n=1 Tax=Peptoniphilus mikwangii TaxID=1354300 RepID=UPI000426DB94|nr:hypothetical protein [Peptoniphilus mikwangii]